MSDSFVMLADIDVTLDEATELSSVVLDGLRKHGIIGNHANEECVLGGTGFPPGQKIADIYKVAKREAPFWKLLTCGVSVRVERGFNEWAMGESCEGYTCPKCNGEIPPFDDDFILGDAIEDWYKNGSEGLGVNCPLCQKNSPLTKWVCRPPFAFSNLAFTFWNWPPFDDLAWQFDIPALVEDLTKHSIVHSYGHI